MESVLSCATLTQYALIQNTVGINPLVQVYSTTCRGGRGCLNQPCDADERVTPVSSKNGSLWVYFACRSHAPDREPVTGADHEELILQSASHHTSHQPANLQPWSTRRILSWSVWRSSRATRPCTRCSRLTSSSRGPSRSSRAMPTVPPWNRPSPSGAPETAPARSCL